MFPLTLYVLLLLVGQSVYAILKYYSNISLVEYLAIPVVVFPGIIISPPAD